MFSRTIFQFELQRWCSSTLCKSKSRSFVYSVVATVRLSLHEGKKYPQDKTYTKKTCGHELSRLRKCAGKKDFRSEEHTYELQSLMRNSYAVFCLKKKTK